MKVLAKLGEQLGPLNAASKAMTRTGVQMYAEPIAVK